ncbi:hypothetical protein BS47DRAFT_1353494, partial [Hydnum rufescens UP504]
CGRRPPALTKIELIYLLPSVPIYASPLLLSLDQGHFDQTLTRSTVDRPPVGLLTIYGTLISVLDSNLSSVWYMDS